LVYYVLDGATGPSKGQNFEIPTANPANYFHVISNPADLPRLAIDGKLFLPASDKCKRNGKLPLVMVVPGSPLAWRPRTSNMPKRWSRTAWRLSCSTALASVTSLGRPPTRPSSLL
jgi:hypothetical protein